MKIFDSVIIISDDLTGANDTAAQFSKYGLKSITTWNSGEINALLKCYDVIAINTESRHINIEIAYRLLLNISKDVNNFCDTSIIYKKVDSTLRGNIGTELKGLYDVIRPDIIVYAPAFPKQGRTTIKGIQLVYGIPIEKAIINNEETNSVEPSNIIMFLDPVLRKLCHHITLDKLRSGVTNDELLKESVVSFDVEEENDLLNIVNIIMNIEGNKKIIWVGSAGLAEYVAQKSLVGHKYGKPVSIVAGSKNDVTRKQVRKLNHELNAKLILIDTMDIICDYKKEFERVKKEVLNAMGVHLDVIITTTYDKSQMYCSENLDRELRFSNTSFSSIFVDKFGILVSSIFNDIGSEKFSGICIVGGDTAASTIRHLGSKSIRVVGEIEPAVPLLICDDINIITKAGGFGSDVVLIKAVLRLKGR